MPTRTGIRALERGLEDGNIPYRLESASLIFETQEIRDLMNCLKATDDPSNQVAIVAALRSPAFGCSDVDLLRHYEQGGRFNYLARQEEPHEGPVAEALAALKDFHEQRGWSSAGALIDRIIRERGLMQSAIGHPRMREQWRRYRFLVERARQFEAAGGGSLRAFVEWTEEQISERARVTEVPVPESDEDSVRVMTIHAAKGLEFPVVILTGINSVPPNRPAHVVFDRQDGSAEVGFGARNNRISTGGYEELLTREKVMSEAERVRLIYVATTRARDHLVLSLRRTAKDGEKSAAGIIADYLPEYGEFWREVELTNSPTARDGETGEDVEPVERVAPVEHSIDSRNQWVAEREALFRRLARPASAAATSLGRKRRDEQDDKEEQDNRRAFAPGPRRHVPGAGGSRRVAGNRPGNRRRHYCPRQRPGHGRGNSWARGRGRPPVARRRRERPLCAAPWPRAVCGGRFRWPSPWAAVRSTVSLTCFLKKATGWWWWTTRPTTSAPRMLMMRCVATASRAAPMPMPSARLPPGRSRKWCSFISTPARRQGWKTWKEPCGTPWPKQSWPWPGQKCSRGVAGQSRSRKSANGRRA